MADYVVALSEYDQKLLETLGDHLSDAVDVLREIRDRMPPRLCPRPANGRPDEFTIEQCVAAKECGCTYGPGGVSQQVGKSE